MFYFCAARWWQCKHFCLGSIRIMRPDMRTTMAAGYSVTGFWWVGVFCRMAFSLEIFIVTSRPYHLLNLLPSVIPAAIACRLAVDMPSVVIFDTIYVFLCAELFAQKHWAANRSCLMDVFGTNDDGRLFLIRCCRCVSVGVWCDIRFLSANQLLSAPTSANCISLSGACLCVCGHCFPSMIFII